MSGGTKNFTGVGGVLSVMIGLIFGGAFLAGGLWARASTQPLADGVIVPGIVVDVDVRSDSDGTTYAPVVDYVDPATGNTHQLTGSVSTSSRPRLGSTEDVSLLPGDPSSARVVGPAWFPWIFISVGGAVILMVGSGAVKGLLGSSDVESNDAQAPADSSVDPHLWTIVNSLGGPDRPGFHPDPDDADRLRYWDGERWTDDFAPVIFDD